MNRRQLVKAISSGAVLITFGGVSIVACNDDNYKPVFFQPDAYQFLSELSENILPDCDESPGAKQAGVASFLDRYIPICKSPEFQDEIKMTTDKLSGLSKNSFGKPFHQLSKEKQTEQMHIYEGMEDKGYAALKSLILFAYFSSMEGMTKALSYVAVPEKYEGDISYHNNQKAWAI